MSKIEIISEKIYFSKSYFTDIHNVIETVTEVFKELGLDHDGLPLPKVRGLPLPIDDFHNEILGEWKNSESHHIDNSEGQRIISHPSFLSSDYRDTYPEVDLNKHLGEF